jgi:hypothetical protein
MLSAGHPRKSRRRQAMAGHRRYFRSTGRLRVMMPRLAAINSTFTWLGSDWALRSSGIRFCEKFIISWHWPELHFREWRRTLRAIAARIHFQAKFIGSNVSNARNLAETVKYGNDFTSGDYALASYFFTGEHREYYNKRVAFVSLRQVFRSRKSHFRNHP